MTVHDALVWCSQQVGKALDYDSQYGAQCTDFFNYYYQHITGRDPYNDGYGVAGAKDIWDVPTDLFDKVKNNEADPNQLPPPGSIIIWDGTLQGSEGFGHVAVVDYGTDSKNIHVYDQNWGGQSVHWQYHKWTPSVIGWLIYKGFEAPAPPRAPTPAPAPAPEPIPTPQPAPKPVVVNDPLPPAEPAPTPPPIPAPIPAPEPAPGPIPEPKPPVVIKPQPVPEPPRPSPMSLVEKLIWAGAAVIVAALAWFFK